ncbi:hypothetical protein ACFL3T_00495 [Patescibacteria group bacterium]
MSEYTPRDPDAPRDHVAEVNEMYDRIGTVRYAIGEENLRAGTFIIYGEKIELYLSEIEDYFETRREVALSLERAAISEAARDIVEGKPRNDVEGMSDKEKIESLQEEIIGMEEVAKQLREVAPERKNIPICVRVISGRVHSFYANDLKHFEAILAIRKRELYRLRLKERGDYFNERPHTWHPFPIDVTQDPRDASICRGPGYGGRGCH